ncbi:hypothetical protein ZWY2020_037787 [Hordeum vulgare]|nr:hypothetical protein ZWY2020_037787 [Hordeum vulgare]
MMENELNTRECRESQTTLRDLQMELMRKSMHVGSRAFAVEGQVKEKTRCCQLLKDLSEKFKALKTEHQILLKESEDYKKCLSDAYRAQRSAPKGMDQRTHLLLNKRTTNEVSHEHMSALLLDSIVDKHAIDIEPDYVKAIQVIVGVAYCCYPQDLPHHFNVMILGSRQPPTDRLPPNTTTSRGATDPSPYSDDDGVAEVDPNVHPKDDGTTVILDEEEDDEEDLFNDDYLK